MANELIRIDVIEDTATPALARLRQRAGDLTPLMRQVAGILHDAVEENFAREGRPRWEPLAPSTIQARRRKGYWPGAILQQRGDLARSITARVTERSAAVGTNLRYAAAQHFGAKIQQAARQQTLYFRAGADGVSRRFVKKRHSNFAQTASRGAVTIEIPARPFLAIGADDRREILTAVSVYLAGISPARR